MNKIYILLYDRMRISITISLILFLSHTFINAQQQNQENPTLKPFRFGGIVGLQGNSPKAVMIKDIPHEQVLKECTFFKGDSLKGFDFDAASKDAVADGVKMYLELKHFMFIKQVAFIKKKFNITALPFELINNAKQAPPENVLASPCTNLDFENGDLSSWTGTHGYNSNSALPFTAPYTGTPYVVNGNYHACSFYSIINTSFGNDVYSSPTAFPGVSASGGTYSARLGSEGINTCWNYYWCANADQDVYYSSAEKLTQTFVVTAANALLTYQYAVVLNDGGHNIGEQPYFQANVTDNTGTILSSCTQYVQEIQSGVTPPGYILSDYVADADFTWVYYLPWKYNSVNLTAYIGQTIKLNFIASGCTLGGHFAYAYVDATCGPAQIILSNATPCTGSTSILTAPAVAGGTYSWSGPGIVGSTTGQTATVNASGIYNVIVTPSQGAACAYTLSTSITFASVAASISSSTNVSCNGGNNGTATVSASGGNPSYTYAWTPSGGNAATGTGLSAGTNYTCLVTDAGGCTKTATVAVTQPAALTTTPSQTNLNCNGICIGSASVTPGGGTPNYTYAWSPSGGASSAASSLCAGNYTVTLSDSKGCTKTQAYTITQPTILSTTQAQTNLNCNGVCIGSASVTPSGGTPNYTYAWSPSGGASSAASSLCAGNYTVTVTDSKGCTSTKAYNITQPTTLATTQAQTNLNCNGVCIGSASVTPSGGTPNYTYAWSPSGGASSAASSLCSGNYTVLVTDSKGCTSTQAYNITQPTTLSTTPAQTNLNCNSVCIGSASVTPSGGTPNYTYAWSPSGGASSAASSLCAGNYTVTVTDSKGCTKNQTYNITQPTTLSTSQSQTNLNCNGVCIGSASVTPSGGTPNYTYAWSPSGGASSAASSLCAGNYTVTVSDSKGCTSTQAYNITQPTTLSTSQAQTNLNCNGVCIGSASVTPSGGTPNYTYAWSPSGGASSAASSLCAGNYTVTVTDSKGCTSTKAYNITQPTTLTSTPGQTNVLCKGICSGAASVSPSGGTPNYTYAWSPSGGASSAASSLCSGNYTVTVTDSKGCTNTQSYTIIQPAKSVSVTASSTNTGCLVANGTASANPSGGTGGFTYSWSPGGQTTSTATGLSAGNYTVYISDANGCTTSAVTSIVTGTGPSISSTSSTPAGCSVSNGTATANPTGGAPNYTYSWSPGGQTTQTASGLTGGTYTAVVTDANLCSVTSVINVPISASPTISSSASSAAGCSLSIGTATVIPTGGTPGYIYNWSPSGQTTQIATGLAGGTYTAVITDANLCTVTSVVNIPITSSPTVTSTSTSPAGCSLSIGTATVVTTGGTPGYTYNWSPGGQTTQVATGLAAGNYSVIITDANGCSVNSTMSVVGTSPPATTVSSTLAGCSVSNGTATANPTGGTPGYTYTWNNGQSTQIATGLATGNYTVTVTDANNCSVVGTVSVSGTSAPSVSSSAVQATCGTNNGTATAIPSGGTPGYSYLWNNGQTTQTATGLGVGSYTVTITDANGCNDATTASITNANGPAATSTVNGNVLCFGGNEGSATINPSGGTPAYTFVWSNGQTSALATGLTAGNYTATVADSNGCVVTSILTISQPAVLASSTSLTNVNCNSGNNGSSTVTATGGTSGYTYVWSNGQTSQTASGLIAGNYSVLVTDAHGCTSTNTVSITEPTVLSNTFSQVNVACSGGTGSAVVNPSGGTPNYTYSWLPSGGNSSAATNLSAGNYTATISDSHGCSTTQTVLITQPTALSSTSAQVNVNCFGDNNGNASVTASGGTTNYTYSWLPSGGNSSAATNLSAGNYSCTITDANGCTAVVPFNVTQPIILATTSSHVDELCNGGISGVASVTASGGTPSYTYLWNNGQTSATVSGLTAGTYSVIVTDSHGCTSVKSETIIEPSPITLSVTGTDSICMGSSAVLNASTSGGTPSYTYVWVPGPYSGSSVAVNPTSATSYSVSLTDANGCTSSLTTPFIVSVNPSPTALFDTASTGMYGSLFSFTDLSTPSVTITAWNWNFGDNSSGSNLQNPVHTFPGSGTYTVTEIAYNQFGCPDTFQITVYVDEGILIPNVFSPDGNGVNDVWYIPNSGMKEFHVEIFDRWGAKVFETTADEIRWDGRSTAGIPLTDGTYYFTLHAILKSGSNGKDYSTTGYVTLLTAKK